MRTSSKLLIAFILLFVLSNCSSDDSEPQVDPDVESPAPDSISDSFSVVSGNIDLPEGSSLNLSSLTVLSSTNNSTISNGNFELDVYGDYTAIYLADANDNVFLIGYKYPNSPNNDITPTSTALGLLMMSPAVLDLSEQGKSILIDRFLTDGNFQLLVEAIEQNIVLGNDLFDPNNTAIMQALVAVFQSSSSRSISNNDELPVFMARAGRNFVFNAGQGDVPNVYNTVIGVYNNDVRIDKIKVKGVQIVPSSIAELFQGGGGSIGDPVNAEYTLPRDGDFTFKFRTGKPGTDDGSLEHEEAFYDNLGQFSYNLLVTLMPFLETSSCATTIINSSISAIQSSSEISKDTKDIGVLLQVADIVLSRSGSIINDCVSEIPLDNKWLLKFLGQWNFVSTAFGVISNGANTTIFGTQWINSNSVTDLCFNAAGNTVEEKECAKSYVKFLDTGEIVGFSDYLTYFDQSNCCSCSDPRRYYLINTGWMVQEDYCGPDYSNPFNDLPINTMIAEVSINNDLSEFYVDFYGKGATPLTRGIAFGGPYWEVAGVDNIVSLEETPEGAFLTGNIKYGENQEIRPVEIVLKF